MSNMQDKVFSIIFDQDEITWQTILYELIKEEGMDPWDVDVSVLTKKYIDMLKKLREMDFRISGKVVLAAAILLRIKSNRLVGEDLNQFDALLAGSDDDEMDEVSGTVTRGTIIFDRDTQKLIPKTPQPRKRKVSIYDLVDALQKALETQRRRTMNQMRQVDVKVPERKFDIGDLMQQVYGRVLSYFRSKKTGLTFTHLVPGQTKSAKILTFIPLLHLTNERKIDLLQEEHFGEIEILLNMNNEDVMRELGPVN